MSILLFKFYKVNSGVILQWLQVECGNQSVFLLPTSITTTAVGCVQEAIEDAQSYGYAQSNTRFYIKSKAQVQATTGIYGVANPFPVHIIVVGY